MVFRGFFARSFFRNHRNSTGLSTQFTGSQHHFNRIARLGLKAAIPIPAPGPPARTVFTLAVLKASESMRCYFVGL